MTAQTHRLKSAAPTKPPAPIPYGSVAMPVSPGDVIQYRLRSMTPGEPERMATVEKVLDTGTIVTSDEVYLYRFDLVDIRVEAQAPAGDADAAAAPATPAAAASGAARAPEGSGESPTPRPPEASAAALSSGRSRGGRIGGQKSHERASRASAPRKEILHLYDGLIECGASSREAIASIIAQHPDLIAGALTTAGATLTYCCLVYWRKIYGLQVGRHPVPDRHDGPQGSAPHPQRPTAGDADGAASQAQPASSAPSGGTRMDEGSGESTTPRPPEASPVDLRTLARNLPAVADEAARIVLCGAGRLAGRIRKHAQVLAADLQTAAGMAGPEEG